MNPPDQRTSTAYAVANPQCQPFHCIYGVAAIFNCHTFCGYAPHAFGTLPVPLRYTAKEPSQAQHSNKKPLHSNHHHRSAYASIKIGGSYLNIMLPYVFASHSLLPSLMQASNRTGCHIRTLC
ncbi:MAG: hypothetical protein EAY81_08725 [Bacteroidetes bacterium]|nr:MAG: hypothetical protein EAY81_08725 [Bacteroidota bacterium]